MGKRVWVYLERDAGGIGEVSLEALSFGSALADESSMTLEAICAGGASEVPKNRPANLSKVYHMVGDGLEAYTADGFGSAIEALVDKGAPDVLIFPSTTQGEDLASWLGAALGVGVLIGAREVRIEGGRCVASRVEFDGKVAVDYELQGSPVILTPEEGASGLPEESSGTVEVVEVPPSASSSKTPLRVVKTEVAARAVNLREAKIIVAVGAGVGSKVGFEQVQELAQLLGGEMGATRAAVDAGWITYDRQIGQTGVKVKPDLYVACGISGAAQHRVGMIESGTIVSINIDAQAPVFRFSHFCVEGDLKVVIPELIRLLRG